MKIYLKILNYFQIYSSKKVNLQLIYIKMKINKIMMK